MIIRLILIFALIGGLGGQVMSEIDTTVTVDAWEYFAITQVEKDSISAEELYLKEISDKALAKEEKKEKITNRVLAVLVVILLVDKFVN